MHTHFRFPDGKSACGDPERNGDKQIHFDNEKFNCAKCKRIVKI